MRLLVWHWGRRGAGPLIATRLASALAAKPGHQVCLSLAASAEILSLPDAPACDWLEPTYESALQYFVQRLLGPLRRRQILKRLRSLRPDIAICAMPALLDLFMVSALRKAGIAYSIVVHDATAHPGYGFHFKLLGQKQLLWNASTLFALSSHVEASLYSQGFGTGHQKIVKLWLPPFHFREMAPPLAHEGPPRLLFFGRLLPYKGLDLLADALEHLGPDLPFDVRICGQGPQSPELARLRALPRVTVENRWVPEQQLPDLIEWADGIVLPYREASQSGVAAAAIAQGRYLLATNVGGLPEQLAGVPGAVLSEPTGPAIAEGLKHLFKTRPAAQPASLQSDWNALASTVLEASGGSTPSRI